MSFLGKFILKNQTGAIQFALLLIVIILLTAGYLYHKNKSILGTATPTIGQLLRVDKIPPSSSDYIYTYVMKADHNGHVYIYWTENADYPNDDRALFRVSADFGKTFTADAVTIPTPPNSQILSAASILYPKMCNDNQGHVYLLREYRPNTWSSGPVKVYVNVSSNYGKSWLSSDIQLSHWNQAPDPVIAQHTTFPQISCDGTGHVYVVWSDQKSSPYNVFFNYSSDYGQTWLTEEIRIDEGINRSNVYNWALPNISSDESGHIFITWQSPRGSKQDIYVNNSQDYGKTWAQPIRVDRAPDSATLYSPTVTSDDNGNVYVGWRDRRISDDVHQIYFNRSHDFGKTWQGSDQRIDHDPAIPNTINLLTPMPLLTSNNFGYVFALWQENAYSSLKPFFNYSNNFGQSWQSQDTNIDNHTTSNQSIRETSLSADNSAHVFSTFEFNRDIWFNYSADNGAGWLPTSLQLDSSFEATEGTELATYGYPYQSNPYLAHDDNGHIFVLFGDNHYLGYGKLPVYLYLVPITVQTTFFPPPTPTPKPTPPPQPSPTFTPTPTPIGIGTTTPSPIITPTPTPPSCNLLPCRGRSHEDQTGWVKVNIKSLKAVYVPKLPQDPLNNESNHYIYCADSDGWELAVKLESEKYKDLMKNDGGDDDNMYELGSNLRLVNVRRGCEY